MPLLGLSGLPVMPASIWPDSFSVSTHLTGAAGAVGAVSSAAQAHGAIAIAIRMPARLPCAALPTSASRDFHTTIIIILAEKFRGIHEPLASAGRAADLY